MSVAAKIKKMAAKILEDVLNRYISLDSLFEWLSSQNNVNDVNIFITQYKCNQVEFASYFLNFLREQSSLIVQSSCSVETPCKSSQLRKSKTLNYSSAKSASAEKELDLKSFESFPALTDGSGRSKTSFRSTDSPLKESPASVKDSSRKFRRLELFPGRKDQDGTVNVESATNSTPKASGKEPVDIADYFNDVVNLDGSSEWSPGFKWKKEANKSEPIETDRFRQNGVSVKSRTFSGDVTTVGRRDCKSSSRAILGDFIVNDSNSSENKKKNKVKRRINPTRVNSLPSQFDINTSFDTSNSVENGPSITEERQTMSLECMNLKGRLEGKNPTEKAYKDHIPVRMFTTPKKIIPKLDPVTCISELKILSKVYSYILDENYCQNMMVELCFVVSLLVIQHHSATELNVYSKDGKNYLNSVHNCVYFAVETLWLQRSILALLNLPALKLLSDNKEIEKFNSELKEFLEKTYVERQAKEAFRRQICVGKGTRHGNVSFECETDNKDNFTSDLNFHSFRKQRDLFYNILANWEQNHLSADWVFSVKLDSKIRTLLSISSDPTNLLHLARLFRSQLVMSCCGDYRPEDESDEEILQLFASVDPEKILRLRARLRSTPKRQGPCPLPDFLGYEEFFKDFIIATSYTVFHYYLKNSLCDEILRLNDAEFSSDLEEDDSCLDQQTQNRYLQQINVLCLLAKFLGFLEFLPYRNEKQWSDRILSVHCAVRQHVLPLFDLESCLKTAFAKHRLTVTVPWIVNYLSMIDFCSARLKCYQSVWKILITIYRQLRNFRNLMNSFYLKLVLGWIFQLPNFPSDLFYNVFEEMNKGCSFELCIELTVGLDSYNVIEENILYSICPYLREINSILTENTGCNVRHIRPVTQGNSTTSAKQLQLRLEENFLHNQSSSTRRTVEFVTERVSSVAVKYLISDVIPKVKEDGLKEINQLDFSDLTDVDDKVEIISEKCFGELMSKCEIQSWLLCSVRSEKAISALLSLDLDSSVRDICTQIVVRQSAEKVKRWIQAHITQAIIRNEFMGIIKKKTKKLAEMSDLSMENWNASFLMDVPQKVLHRTGLEEVEEYPVSPVYIAFREIMWNIYEGGKVEWDEVNSIFQSTLKILESAKRISPATERSLLGLTLDLLIIICMRYETDFRKTDFTELFKLLKGFNEVKCPGNTLERVICPRNLALLARDSRKNLSWRNFGSLLLFFLDEKLLTQDQVETQLVSFLRHNWEKEEETLFADMFDHILKKYVQGNGCDEFSVLLEYLKETMAANYDPGLDLD